MAEAISLEMGAPMDWATDVQTGSGQTHLEDFILRLKDFEFDEHFDENCIKIHQKTIQAPSKTHLNFHLVIDRFLFDRLKRKHRFSIPKSIKFNKKPSAHHTNNTTST